jgi:recombination protein U
MAKIEHKRIKAYFIINFREKEKTFAVEAKELKNYMESTERKSIPFDWCRENGIYIDAQKKKVHYRYLMKEFFDRASEIN